MKETYQIFFLIPERPAKKASWLPSAKIVALLVLCLLGWFPGRSQGTSNISGFNLIDDPNAITRSVPTPGTGNGSGLPELFSAYPNPFSSSSEIRLDLPKDTEVTLEVYGLYSGPGKKQVLYDGSLAAGKHTFTFKPSEGTVSGIYLVRFRMDTHLFTTRLLRLRN